MEDLSFVEADEGAWVAEGYETESRSPFSVIVFNTEVRPNAEETKRILARLDHLDTLVRSAAELVRQNYDTEHFRSLGVNEDRLVIDETPDAMAKVIKLVSVQFFDSTCEDYELSFAVPWDDGSHTYDVEFDGTDAVSCSVNG